MREIYSSQYDNIMKRNNKALLTRRGSQYTDRERERTTWRSVAFIQECSPAWSEKMQERKRLDRGRLALVVALINCIPRS